jgi:uncharacterized protein
MPRIRITWASGEVSAELRDTPTVRGLIAVLPCDASANTWGKEVYFNVPLTAKPEADAQQVVDAGAVCFWVEGRALALPFGPTPISRGTECRLVTRCNVLGRLEGDAGMLGAVRDGDAIHVTLIDS